MENLSASGSAVNEVYGIALYEASADLKQTNGFKTALAEIGEVFAEYPQFSGLLRTPAISKAQRCEAARKVFEGKIPQELLNFICILIGKRRIGSFDGIAGTFNRLVDRRDGVAKGRIISAVPLASEQLAKLEEQTGALLQEKVSLAPEVDATLIGGVKIYVSGKLIDASIRKKLDDMKELLLQ